MSAAAETLVTESLAPAPESATAAVSATDSLDTAPPVRLEESVIARAMQEAERSNRAIYDVLAEASGLTGDRYARDTDGYFVYQGRADDMLKVGGIWVSPVEVENTLVGHPAVLEAAVVGHEDTDRLVKPKAFIVLKEGRTGSAPLQSELQGFVKDKLAPYKYPRWIEFVTELPKTATGKIQRFKLRQ